MKIKTLAGLSVTFLLTTFAAVGLATEDQAKPAAFFPESPYEFFRGTGRYQRRA